MIFLIPALRSLHSSGLPRSPYPRSHKAALSLSFSLSPSHLLTEKRPGDQIYFHRFTKLSLFYPCAPSAAIFSSIFLRAANIISFLRFSSRAWRSDLFVDQDLDFDLLVLDGVVVLAEEGSSFVGVSEDVGDDRRDWRL